MTNGLNQAAVGAGGPREGMNAWRIGRDFLGSEEERDADGPGEEVKIMSAASSACPAAQSQAHRAVECVTAW